MAVHRWRRDHGMLRANTASAPEHRRNKHRNSLSHHPIHRQCGQKVQANAAALHARQRRQGPGSDLRCSPRGIKRFGARQGPGSDLRCSPRGIKRFGASRHDQGCAIFLDWLKSASTLDSNCSAVQGIKCVCSMNKDDDAFSLFLQKPKIAYPIYPFGYTREK